jgi:hypothetical protein
MCRLLAWVSFCCTPLLFLHAEAKVDINSIVLQQVSAMPSGGGYSTKPKAHQALTSSMKLSPTDGLLINAALAKPSFCSGATYMIFLKTLVSLRQSYAISVPAQTWKALLAGQQPDGVGIWGRWNANGPGTGCLFHELNLGKNFTNFAEAKPGDFAKFFWTSEVGKYEHGHSVVYLGSENRNGVDMVRFWSSNIPGGYGEKSIPRKKIALAIFSRLTNPQNIGKYLSPKNDYLASLITKRSSFQEALSQCGAMTR